MLGLRFSPALCFSAAGANDTLRRRYINPEIIEPSDTAVTLIPISVCRIIEDNGLELMTDPIRSENRMKVIMKAKNDCNGLTDPIRSENV